jgi:hypothetical protein
MLLAVPEQEDLSPEERNEAWRQFRFHQKRHEELTERFVKLRDEAFAHHRVLEGLARLYPFLIEAYGETFIREGQESGTGVESETVTPVVGIEALRRVMSGTPGNLFSLRDIYLMLQQEGLAPSSMRVLRNTLNRAIKGGVVGRIDEKGKDGRSSLIWYAWISGNILTPETIAAIEPPGGAPD